MVTHQHALASHCECHEPLGQGGLGALIDNGQVEHVTVLVDEVIHLVAGYADDLMPVGEVAHQPSGKFDAPIAVGASAIQLLPQTLCELRRFLPRISPYGISPIKRLDFDGGWVFQGRDHEAGVAHHHGHIGN
ncbi:hypothetical protein D3C73_1240070 [compost metagenome]